MKIKVTDLKKDHIYVIDKNNYVSHHKILAINKKNQNRISITWQIIAPYKSNSETYDYFLNESLSFDYIIKPKETEFNILNYV